MALPACLNDLKASRLPDVAFFFVHRLQTHDARIPAVAAHATESFRCMDIGFEIFSRLGQVLDAQR